MRERETRGVRRRAPAPDVMCPRRLPQGRSGRGGDCGNCSPPRSVKRGRAETRFVPSGEGSTRRPGKAQPASQPVAGFSSHNVAFCRLPAHSKRQSLRRVGWPSGPLGCRKCSSGRAPDVEPVQVSPGAELRTGSTVTLHCLLDTNWSPEHCPSPLHSYTVIWVTETGAELQGDRYQISSSPCSSYLTVRLQPSDHSRQWRCDVTQDRAVTFTHRYSTLLTDGSGARPTPQKPGRTETSPAGKTPVTQSEPGPGPEMTSSSVTVLAVRLTVFFIVLIIPLVVGVVIYTKRRNSKLAEESWTELDTRN
ncbi:uncharacterized protein [Lepisosteus oculatus]|uniref:uncharacterized protein isoform X3 n=1 Tax=Lepisosteus oculatus TaxID=7918 RepID=UPI0035F523A9